jgi:hypothetical protein
VAFLEEVVGEVAADFSGGAGESDAHARNPNDQGSMTNDGGLLA